MQIGILKLPEATEVNNNSIFILQSYSGNLSAGVTQKLYLSNIVLGDNNVTFSPTISSHTTDIEYLDTVYNTLSSDAKTGTGLLSSYIVNYVTKTFKNLVSNMYPVGSVRYSSSNINPSNYISNTTWTLIAQAQFVAGVGDITQNGIQGSVNFANGDKNGQIVTIYAGNSGTNAANDNFSVGEYTHKVTTSEIPAHTHSWAPIGFQGADTSSGSIVQSAGGPPNYTKIAPLVSTVNGEDQYHNNIPPVYGVYIWLRTA